MESIHKYNLTKIVKVVFHPKRESNYKWHEATRSFFGLFKGEPEGFYSTRWGLSFDVHADKREYSVEGKKVFELPSVIVVFSEKVHVTRIFNSDGEAQKFINVVNAMRSSSDLVDLMNLKIEIKD